MSKTWVNCETSWTSSSAPIDAMAPLAHLVICFFTGVAALSPFQVAAVAAEAPALSEERIAIVERAHQYAAVVWRGEERHVFHGEDEAGVRIDTPDETFDPAGWRPGEDYAGMPYCWGGFTGLDELEARLAEGGLAGHVPSQGNARSSARAFGLDCSGLVSRVWNLPVKQSTRSIGALSYELGDYSELLPGDVVNRFDAHVAVFVAWANEERTEMRVIEAARIKVAEATYAVDLLRSAEFLPMRYKTLDERWQPMPPPPGPGLARPVLTEFTERPAADRATNGVLGDPLPKTLRAGETRPGAWARYAAAESGLGGDDVSCVWMAVEGAPEELLLQRRLDVGTQALATGATLALNGSWPELLAAFGHFSNPLRDLEAVESELVPGTWTRGDLELEARRLTAVLEGSMLSRSTLYPVRIEIQCVLSEDVPLLGVCEASFAFEVEYGRRGEERILGGAQHRYELLELGGA